MSVFVRGGRKVLDWEERSEAGAGGCDRRFSMHHGVPESLE